MADRKQFTVNVKKGGNAQVGEFYLSKGECAMTNPVFGIDTNFDVKNTVAFDIVSGGLFYRIAADVNFDTGTTEALAADTWGIAILTITTAGVGTLTWAGVDYSTEALAIAAVDGITVPAGEIFLGYVTVKTGAATAWTAGTDALQGGTGGTPSADTNYYAVCGRVL